MIIVIIIFYIFFFGCPVNNETRVITEIHGDGGREFCVRRIEKIGSTNYTRVWYRRHVCVLAYPRTRRTTTDLIAFNAPGSHSISVIHSIHGGTKKHAHTPISSFFRFLYRKFFGAYTALPLVFPQEIFFFSNQTEYYWHRRVFESVVFFSPAFVYQ